MNPRFLHSAASALLPSAPRQHNFLISSLNTTRWFSSSSNARSVNREMEKELLGTNTQQPAKETLSPLSAMSKTAQEDKSRSTTSSANRDYFRMAESLEAEMIRNPYSDKGPPHNLHVFSHRHNTILTLTRPNGDPMMCKSCGHLGFRKAGRSGYDPAYQLSSHVFGQIQEKGWLLDIQRLTLIYRGFGPGRQAFNKVLLGNEGKNIRALVCKVTDSTKIKFGGTRSRKVRRLG